MSGATRRPAFRRTRRSLAGCALRDRGVWESICHHLVMADRERTGREAGPTAAVIDSQSAKTTEAGGPRGRDSGKTVRAASATPWSTPMAARWSCSATLPACRTATAPSLSCAPPPGMRACPAVRLAARRPPTVEASWRRRKNLRSGALRLRLLARCYSLSVAYDAHTRCCHASPARWREHRSRDEATAEAGPRYARPSDRRHSRCGRMLRPAGIAPRGRIMVAAQLKVPAPIIRAPAVSLVEPIGIEPTTS